MRPSDAEPTPWLGLAGLALAAVLALAASRRRPGPDDLGRFYQAGFVQAAVALSPHSTATAAQAQALAARAQRADVIRRFDPERLRAVPPYLVGADGRFWPSLSDVLPRASFDLRWDGPENGLLRVTPAGAPAWKVPLRSKGLVRPDWSAYSNLVAYYDLDRVWIADVQGRRFQSLVQEPLLDEGGVLKFSADGTALAFWFRSDRAWKAQELYVLVEKP